LPLDDDVDAQIVVATSGRRLYGSVILRKGMIRPH
jgi:L-fucose mutarotase/ribose pyranase (RbsD/FucU family)